MTDISNTIFIKDTIITYQDKAIDEEIAISFLDQIATNKAWYVGHFSELISISDFCSGTRPIKGMKKKRNLKSDTWLLN